METSETLPAQVSDTAPIEVEAGTQAVVAREQYEIQAASLLAKKFPRDETVAYAKIMKAMTRPGLAAAANYSFPRGGKNISGASVDLARELARCWGNIRHGVRVIQMDEEWVQIGAFALDVETNTCIQGEDKFRRLIQRKISGVTTWVKPDERDLRELVNRRGAILVRNCILQVLPSDVISDATNKARETLDKQTKGDLKTNREDVIRGLVMAFDSMGIKVDVIEKKLGHPMSALTQPEVVELRQVWKSLADGNSTADEHFDFNQGKSESPTPETTNLTEKIKKGAEAAAPKPSPENPETK